MHRWLILLLGLFMLVCAPRKTKKVVTPAEEYPLYEIEEGEEIKKREIPKKEVGVVRMGYRVQIFASDYNERAEQIAAEAKFKFTEPVYVEYVPGTVGPYKVRVGDFKNRVDAEILREKARRMGYPDAWIVETEIKVYQ